MAIISRLQSCKVAVLLNNGTQNGKVKTLSVNLGAINTDRYNDQKAMNIVNLAGNCFDKNIYEVRKTEVSKITDSNA